MIFLGQEFDERVNFIRSNPLQNYIRRFKRRYPNGNHWGFSRRDIRKYQCPLSTPAVNAVELTGREINNRI